MLISFESLKYEIPMLSTIKTRFQRLFGQSPFTLFFTALALLFGMILISHFSRQPETIDKANVKEAKMVERFVIGHDTVTTSSSALVKKTTLQPIVALTSGTVEHISVRPGSYMNAGTSLLRLSADYGANRAGLETTLAEKNQRFALDIARLDRKIIALEEKKIRKDDSASDTETELTLKQLKRQRAVLNESLSTGEISVDISHAGAAVWEPKAVVPGTVEYLAVQVGDFVTPGTLLAMLRTEKGATTLDTFIDPTLARAFDPTLPSHLMLTTNETPLEVFPSFFSKIETKDGLFNIRYLISQDQATEVAANTRVTLSLPLRTVNAEGHTIIPLDALFIHTNHASIFIERDGKAEEQTVSVQEIFGNAALLHEILPVDTVLLLNRTLVSGEAIAQAQ